MTRSFTRTDIEKYIQEIHGTPANIVITIESVQLVSLPGVTEIWLVTYRAEYTNEPTIGPFRNIQLVYEESSNEQKCLLPGITRNIPPGCATVEEENEALNLG